MFLFFKICMRPLRLLILLNKWPFRVFAYFLNCSGPHVHKNAVCGEGGMLWEFLFSAFVCLLCADRALAVSGAIIPAPTSLGLQLPASIWPLGFLYTAGPRKRKWGFSHTSNPEPTQGPSQGGRCLCPFRLRKTTQTKKWQGEKRVHPSPTGRWSSREFFKEAVSASCHPDFSFGRQHPGIGEQQCKYRWSDCLQHQRN